MLTNKKNVIELDKFNRSIVASRQASDSYVGIQEERALFVNLHATQKASSIKWETVAFNLQTRLLVSLQHRGGQ